MRRYDRDGVLRIHCISAGTALRAQTVAGQEPDLAYPSLAQLRRRAGGAHGAANLRDMQELFRRMVFNILIDNTDDHEKNHALRVVAPTRQGKYRLAPACDVLPTNSGQGYQEFVVGTAQRESTLPNAMSQCELFGFTPRQAAAEVVRAIKVVMAGVSTSLLVVSRMPPLKAWPSAWTVTHCLCSGRPSTRRITWPRGKHHGAEALSPGTVQPRLSAWARQFSSRDASTSSLANALRVARTVSASSCAGSIKPACR